MRHSPTVWAVAAGCVGLAHAQVLSAVTNFTIDTSPSFLPIWETGSVQVSWFPPVDWAPASYTVQVAPLDYTNDFSSNRTFQDFVVSTGRSSHSVYVNTAVQMLAVNYSGSSWQNSALGRGYSPYAFRRIPENSILELQTTDCSTPPAGSTRYSCGLVAFNAGFMKPMFTAYVDYTVSTGRTIFTVEGLSLSVNFSTADAGLPWSLSGTQFRVETNTGDSMRPFVVLARVNTSLAWANVTTRVPIPLFAVDPGTDKGDIWWGVGARAIGAPTSSAIAYFDNLRIFMPVPTSPPLDLYGGRDLCISSNVTAINMTVAGDANNVTFRGLSNNFPYTVTIYARDAMWQWAPPSAPLEGTYFWARRAPPRQQRLGLWLNARWLPYGNLQNWPDASGNQHHMKQSYPSSLLKPYVYYRYSNPVCTGICGSEYMTPSYARFERSYGNFMWTGADSIDLGITGPMTFYYLGRNWRSDPAIFAGKGVMSSDFGRTPSGYVIGQTGTPTEIAQNTAWFGMRVSSNKADPTLQTYTGQAGFSARNYYYSGQYGYLFSQTVEPADAVTAAKYPSTTYLPRELDPNRFGNFSVNACQDVQCSQRNRRLQFDLHVNFSVPNFDAPVMPQWQPSATDPVNAMDLLQPIGSHNYFHIGGANTPNGEPALAFGGEVNDVLIYREAHTPAQRAQVMQWASVQFDSGYCNRDLRSPSVGYWYGSCQAGGSQNGNNYYCYQFCNYPTVLYLGYNYHSCYDGAWDQPAAICKVQCQDVAPPIYLASCAHRWLNEPFNATANPDLSNLFMHFPSMPEHYRARVWVFNQTTMMVDANTRQVDTCNRIRPMDSILGLHYYRWDTLVTQVQQQNASVDIRLKDVNTTAGVVVRLYSESYNYRCEINAVTGARIIRTNGYYIGQTIVRVTNVTVVPGRWFNFLCGIQSKRLYMAINGVQIAVVDEPVIPTQLLYGGFGMYLAAGGEANFDNLTFDTDCDYSGVARNMFESHEIIYRCKPGYSVVGNTTWQCNSKGDYGNSSLICLSKPPIVTPTPVFYLDEFSRNGSFVGQPLAQPANPDQSLTFILAAQYPPISTFNYTPTFTVSSCSGAIRVNDPASLDSIQTPNFTLSLFAWPDTQMQAGVSWNVTVVLNTLPTAPVLYANTVNISAAYTGPVQGLVWQFTNRNKYPLRWSIFAGQTSPPLFAIDPLKGNLTILSPGLTWAPDAQSVQLYVMLAADGVTADISLSSLAILTINIIDVNVPPVWRSVPVLTVSEATLKANLLVGTVSASDPNSLNPAAPANWYNISYTMTQNANWKTAQNVFSLTADGALTLLPVLTFDAADFAWFDRLKVRTVLYVTVMACDRGTPSLCTNSSVAVAITPNNTQTAMALPYVSSITVNPLPSNTPQVITIQGADFVGSVISVRYGPFSATGCTILNAATVIECYSVAGYGTNHPFSVMIDGTVANSSTIYYANYLPPTITGVSVVGTPLTSAGNDVTISGSNLYGPITMTLDGVQMQLKAGGNFSSSHTSVTATLVAGCGQNLPVQVVVGGQPSTCTGTCAVSFSPPTLSGATPATAGSFNVTALSTLGGETLRVSGGNFGTSATAPILYYKDGTGTYQYSTVCSKSTNPHSAMDCTTVAGVGRQLWFSVQVCGQSSGWMRLSNASYAAPVLRDLSGPRALTTEGGQQIKLLVANVGPVNNINSMPQSIVSVTYGRVGGRQYTAVSCFVSFATASNSEITCTTAPGTGSSLVWTLNVGYQDSNSYASNITYSQPSLYYFSGPGSDQADTEGGPAYYVDLFGSNFGETNATLTVWYSALLATPRDTDNMLPTTPGQPDGTIRFTPTSCDFIVAHRQIRCVMPPSAGQTLSWGIRVDGLESTSPVTSFAAPTIHSVWLNMSSPASALSTDGRQQIVIDGRYFGLEFVVQQIRYGPSGSEYSAQLISATSRRIVALTRPGIGSSLSFMVKVADQNSNGFRSNISYAFPNITSMSATVIPAVADVGQYSQLTAYGTDFGLLNPDVVVEVVFGNPADGRVVRLPVQIRNPSIVQVSTLGFNPGPSPVQQSVTFTAPAGLGRNRAVRLLQYLRGTTVRDQDIATLALQGAAAFVSYSDPRIEYVLLYPMSTAEIAQFVAPLFPGAPAGMLANARRAEVVGVHFHYGINADSIVRAIEVRTGGVNSTWDRNLAGYYPSNWTNYRIICYVLPPQGELRIAIDSMSFDATTTYKQVSNTFAYSDLSATVSGLTGAPATGYSTLGGPGSVMSLQANGLSGTTQLNVTVTIGGVITQCKLLQLDGTTYVDNFAGAVAMLSAQSNGVLQATTMYTIKAEVPPGQGVNLPVTIWRNGAPGASAVSNLISYAKPAFLQAGTMDPATNTFNMQTFAGSIELRVPTDGTGWVRVVVSNGGICPSVDLLHQNGPPVSIPACLTSRDINGVTQRTSNPAVRYDHTTGVFDFQVPAGEGSGYLFSLAGWYFTFGAGDGLERLDADGRVLVRYRSPVITSVSAPTPISTQGFSGRIYINGQNFGISTPQVRLVRGSLSVPCINVVRESATNVSCVVTDGIGINLQPQVTVADLVGTGSSAASAFSYTAPSIATVSFIPASSATSSVVAALRSGTVPASAVTAATAFIGAPDGSGPQINASMHGRDVLVLDGSSFGAASAVSCAFAAWPPAWGSSMVLGSFPPTALVSVGVPACDGMETFLGEGEIFTNSSVLFWNHSRVIILTPPGVGTRMVTLSIGMQFPPQSQRYANLRYEPATLMPTLRALRGNLGTDGGDPLAIDGLFAYPTINSFANDSSRSLRFPIMLPLPDGQQMPTEQLRIDLTSPRAVVPCLATAYSAAGSVPPGFAQCRMPAVQSITSTGGVDTIIIATPPGVGVNKSLQVSYISADGSLISSTAIANYSYDAPSITKLFPDLIQSTDSMVPIYVSADNVGRVRDIPFMSAEEQELEIWVGEHECMEPQRVLRNTADAVQCKLKISNFTAGFHSISITVAGQTGRVSADSDLALLVGCPYGTFGHIGEACLTCPIGGICRGFRAEEYGIVDASGNSAVLGTYVAVNISSGPVMVGDVVVARRGFHTYPVPMRGFFNLNGTDEGGMASACPPNVRALNPDRDICIVGCVPPDACLGENLCSDPYISKAPYFRCSDCNKGFYRSNGDCIKCPDSPIMTFVGFGMIIVFVAFAGYMLNKFSFDIRMVSIGIDFFQVLAVLAQSKVAWPTEIKRIFRILSAFNLNIEVVAPECLIPNMSYLQRFYITLFLPFAVVVMFLIINGTRFFISRCYFKQKNWRNQLASMASSISIGLLLLFLFYLQDAKTCFGTFQCLPSEPDDGKTYLQVGTFEECGGKLQKELIPPSIAGLILLVAGYPLGVGFALYKFRETIMLDQLLLASRITPAKNSTVAIVRAALSRTYYSFKPQHCYYWILLIILRKFGVALSSLIFSQNSSFQLSCCCLVLFLAFGAHMRSLPYMDADDYDEVLANCLERSKSSPFWHQLRLRVLDAGEAQKKETRRNGIKLNNVAAATAFVGKSLLKFNIVEAILLFLAALVCLLGVLLQVVRVTDSYYEDSRKSVTYNLILLIVVGVTYFTCALVADLVLQYNSKRTAKAERVVLDRKAKAVRADKGPSGMAILKGAASMDMATSNNPMMMMGAIKSAGQDGSMQSLASMDEVPTKAAWVMFRDQMQDMASQIKQLHEQISDLKGENMRLTEKVDTSSSHGPSRAPRRAEGAARKQFEPARAAATDAAPSMSPWGAFKSNNVGRAAVGRVNKRMSMSRAKLTIVDTDADADGASTEMGAATPLSSTD